MKVSVIPDVRGAISRVLVRLKPHTASARVVIASCVVMFWAAPAFLSGLSAMQGGTDQMMRDMAVASLNHMRAGEGWMSPAEMRFIRRWDAALEAWLGEPGEHADAELAHGALFECLARYGSNVWTPAVNGEPGHSRKPFILAPADSKGRPGRALKALGRARTLDPSLTEAALRQLHVGTMQGDRTAATELEAFAGSAAPGSQRYVAAILRARVAQENKDWPAAARWFEEAARIHAPGVAARIALGVYRGEAEREPWPDQTADPFYTFPCRLLTPAVAAALESRMSAVPEPKK